MISILYTIYKILYINIKNYYYYPTTSTMASKERTYLWASSNSDINIIKEISYTDSSSIFQIMNNNTYYAMKVVNNYKDFIRMILIT